MNVSADKIKGDNPEGFGNLGNHTNKEFFGKYHGDYLQLPKKKKRD